MTAPFDTAIKTLDALAKELSVYAARVQACREVGGALDAMDQAWLLIERAARDLGAAAKAERARIRTSRRN